MKNLLLSFILITATACGSEGLTVGDFSCSNTKDLFSNWTLTNDATTSVDISDGVWDGLIHIAYGEGACDQTRGDFLMRFQENGLIDFRDCTNTFSTDTADWSINCNILTVTYHSNNFTENYR